jgi:hypothetical protein
MDANTTQIDIYSQLGNAKVNVLSLSYRSPKKAQEFSKFMVKDVIPNGQYTMKVDHKYNTAFDDPLIRFGYALKPCFETHFDYLSELFEAHGGAF